MKVIGTCAGIVISVLGTAVGLVILRYSILFAFQSNFSADNLEAVMNAHISCLIPVASHCESLNDLQPLEPSTLEYFKKRSQERE